MPGPTTAGGATDMWGRGPRSCSVRDYRPGSCARPGPRRAERRATGSPARRSRTGTVPVLRRCAVRAAQQFHRYRGVPGPLSAPGAGIVLRLLCREVMALPPVARNSCRTFGPVCEHRSGGRAAARAWWRGRPRGSHWEPAASARTGSGSRGGRRARPGPAHRRGADAGCCRACGIGGSRVRPAMPGSPDRRRTGPAGGFRPPGSARVSRRSLRRSPGGAGCPGARGAGELR